LFNERVSARVIAVTSLIATPLCSRARRHHRHWRSVKPLPPQAFGAIIKNM
jgi:hypothetical protein